MTGVVLLDLDGTLVAQEEAFERAYRATGEFAASRAGLVAGEFARRIPEVTDRVLHDAPFADCVRRCRFGGRDILWGEAVAGGGCEGEIAAGIDAFRERVWSDVLASFGVGSTELCTELGPVFVQAMTEEVSLYSEVAEALRAVGQACRLAVVTNGMLGAQRAKLRRLGIDHHFDAVIASVQVGVGKPAAVIFEAALEAMGAEPDQAVMVGDALDGDMDGAKWVGMRAIWVNRDGRPRPSRAVEPDAEIRDLTALGAAIEASIDDR